VHTPKVRTIGVGGGGGGNGGDGPGLGGGASGGYGGQNGGSGGGLIFSLASYDGPQKQFGAGSVSGATTSSTRSDFISNESYPNRPNAWHRCAHEPGVGAGACT
jgi:hypothetical protein